MNKRIKIWIRFKRSLYLAEKIEKIKKVIANTGDTPSTSAIKERLDENFSYGEIRMVMAQMKK